MTMPAGWGYAPATHKDPARRARPVRAKKVAAELAKHPALMSLSDTLLCRDITDRWPGVLLTTAGRAVNLARRFNMLDRSTLGG